MTRFQSTTGEFARRGFESASSAAALWERWSERVGGQPMDLAAFEVAADRDQALDALERFAAVDPQLFEEVTKDPSWLRRLILVLGASSVLAQTVVRHPEEAHSLAVEPRPRGREGWLAFFTKRCRPSGGVAEGSTDTLRLANRVALLEIAARDLGATDPIAAVDDIACELSHVADAVLELSLAYARAEVPGWERTRLAVLAMGKAGAQELNYISDVDVVYVVEPLGEASPEEAVAIGGRLAAAQARICSAYTAEGTIWQVDSALRPEGKAGPLVRTLASCRTYYQRWAKNWEFQAMLKSRPAAGDLALGREFVDMVQPMVWQAAERPEFLPEVRAMRERVIALIPAKEAAGEIKLGQGGLRDTEFSVQLLQLVHGRADERLRTRSTFEGLRELVRCGYIGRLDGAQMEQAYRFQRLLEHRIQLRRMRRTHLFPDEPVALAQLARSIGLSAEELSRQWKSSTGKVRRLQQRLFFSPLLDAVCHVSTDGLRLSPDAAQTRMGALGFGDPRAAMGHLEALTRGSDRRAEIQRHLMPAMLEWLALGPNPDFGLLSFRQLSESLGTSSWYMRALRDEGYMAHRLAQVCSSSRYVVDLLKRSPDMIQMLANTNELKPRSAEQLAQSMRQVADRYDDVEQAARAVRALRRAELCRIALADVLGPENLSVVTAALSDLTSATLDAALALARREIDAPEVGIIAMGRWGGREMTYPSDADCMVVVPDGTEGEAVTAAIRLMRRVSGLVGSAGPDPALDLDTDLRPEGKGGPQVRTVASYGHYYEKWAATWEAQALLRARHGAGSAELTGAVLDAASWFRYPTRGLTTVQVSEIRKLKSRMENERIPKGISRERHLKLGSGGLSDVEWTVQLLQLQHAYAHPGLQVTSTLPPLQLLARLGIVPPHLAQRLEDAWLRASRLRNAIMLVRGRASDAMPSDLRELAAIAELLGFPREVSRLVEDTRKRLRLAHAAVGQLFWGDA